MPAGLHITGNNGDQLSGIAQLELPGRADSSTLLPGLEKPSFFEKSF